MTTSGKTFDIEDLSLLIKRRGEEQPKPVGRSTSDMSLPIIVEPIFDDVQDPALVIIDTMTDVERAAYRFAQGSYIRYRIGVLGIGQAVEEVHQRLHETLDGSTDELIKKYNLWSRYQVALFGGAPRGEVQIQDADLLADRLAFFKPNYLVLVNAGQTKNKFADKTARQLALLTHHVNAGAMSGGQRPYTLVIVTDEPIAAAIFVQYTRACQAMNTFPAVEQFTLDEGRQLVAHARAQLAEYAARHMQVRRREAP